MIDVEGEPYVKAEGDDVPHPALDGHVYVPQESKVDDSCQLVDDLKEALHCGSAR